MKTPPEERRKSIDALNKEISGQDPERDIFPIDTVRSIADKINIHDHDAQLELQKKLCEVAVFVLSIRRAHGSYRANAAFQTWLRKKIIEPATLLRESLGEYEDDNKISPLFMDSYAEFAKFRGQLESFIRYASMQTETIKVYPDAPKRRRLSEYKLLIAAELTEVFKATTHRKPTTIEDQGTRGEYVEFIDEAGTRILAVGFANDPDFVITNPDLSFLRQMRSVKRKRNSQQKDTIL